MPYGDLVSQVDFDLSRDSAFSYACHACNRCCRNKAIRVGPYEILCLARLLDLSTTDFIARHTEAGGTVLRTKENGDCGFLGPRGCSVHSDRPLACRIYPLARWVTPGGVETFGHLTPHPQTEGVYGRTGTVQDYLDHQGLAPFFEMSERYGAVYQRLVDLLERLDPAELDRRPQYRAAIDDLPPGMTVSLWIDVDATIAAADNIPDVHRDVSEAVDRHIAVIEAWIAELERIPETAETHHPHSVRPGDDAECGEPPALTLYRSSSK